MTDDLARTVEFERSLHRRMATRLERFAWGTAYLDDRYPTRWDSNFLWVEAPLAGVSGAALAYARLGFDPIGGLWSLVRPPEKASAYRL
jgi:hypothetical protein